MLRASFRASYRRRYGAPEVPAIKFICDAEKWCFALPLGVPRSALIQCARSAIRSSSYVMQKIGTLRFLRASAQAGTHFPHTFVCLRQGVPGPRKVIPDDPNIVHHSQRPNPGCNPYCKSKIVDHLAINDSCACVCSAQPSRVLAGFLRETHEEELMSWSSIVTTEQQPR